MANKIQVTLDTAKLKGLTTERTYKNRDGQEVSVKELKFELIEVKEPKVIFSGDKYDLVKTHFASKVQTKEEREAKADTIYLGEGFTTVWKNDTISEAKIVPVEDDEDPF